MKSAPANIPLTYPIELPITERRAEIVDAIRANQVLVAYRGRDPIYATLVSSGRPGHQTHAGTFRVWAKLITDRMANEEPTEPDEARAGEHE